MGKINVKWKVYVNENGIKVVNFRTKSFTTDCYKLYNNTSYKFAKLDMTAILLFHYICENMDDSNNIVHTCALRREYIAHSKKNLGRNVKDETVKKAFIKLVKVGLLINYDVKSDFTVNPRHVSKSSEEIRRSLINTLLRKMALTSVTKSNFKRALGIE
jgi:hypothetical protein